MERIITVKGTIENMSKAEALISAKLRQSYENDLQAMVVSKVGIPISFYLSYIILDCRVYYYQIYVI